MTTVATLAAEMSASFETRTRTNGDEFRCLKDGSPEWMTDVLFDAHDGMLPDDWRYRMVESAVDAIADSDGNEDESGEAADAFVPVYNRDRLEWLASNLTRAGYCDDAASEGLVADDAPILDRIAAGIYAEFQEVYSAVVEALRTQVENSDDDDDDSDND